MDLEHMKIGAMVAEDYRTAEVFKNHGLDFCCGGGKSIVQACQEKNVDAEKLVNELIAVQEGPSNDRNDCNSWELDFLVDYIINTHHVYVSKNIPLILEFAEKVAEVHADGSPEVVQIFKLFSELADELDVHMQKEEKILFPYIKELLEIKKKGGSTFPAPFGSVENPIAMMEHEHEAAGDNLKEITKLSNNFTPPAHACNTFNVLYAKLKEFQDDLHQHIHLENNILFPKTVALEDEINAPNSCSF